MKRITIEEILLDEHIYKIEIENIRAGRNIDISLQQFIRNTDYYERLQRKIKRYQRAITRLGPLDSASLDHSRRLSDLENEERNFKIELLEYARLIYKLDTQGVPVASQLKSVSEQGNLQAASDLVNEVHLDNTYQGLTSQLGVDQNLAAVYEKLVVNSQEFLVKARLTALTIDLPDRFEQSVHFFEKSCQSARRALNDPINYADCLLATGSFLQRHHQNKAAMTYLTQSLGLWQSEAIVSTQADPFTVSILFNNLGLLHRADGRLDQALAEHLKALHIRQKLAKKQSASYLAAVADSLTNIGAVYQTWHKYSQANTYYRRVYAIQKKLVSANPGQFEDDFAQTLMNLGVTERNMGLPKRALYHYKAASRLQEPLAGKDFNRYAMAWSRTLNNLAVVYMHDQQYAEAEPAFTKTISIRRQLAQINPYAYLPSLATTLSNVAYFYQNIARFEQSKDYLVEAVAIRNTLASANPETFQPELARSLTNLGRLFFLRNQYDQAKSAYEDALAAFRERNSNDVYDSEIADLLFNLGTVARDTGAVESARDLYDQSLDIKRNLIQQNPVYSTSSLTGVLTHLAYVYEDLGRPKESELAYQEALTILKELSIANPNQYWPSLANTQISLASLYADLKRYSEAELLFNEALTVQRKLAQQNRVINLPALLNSLNTFASYCETVQNYARAKAAYEEALPIGRSLVALDQDAYLPNLALIAGNLSDFFRQFDPDQALSLFYAREAYHAAAPYRGKIRLMDQVLRQLDEILSFWKADI